MKKIYIVGFVVLIFLIALLLLFLIRIFIGCSSNLESFNADMFSLQKLFYTKGKQRERYLLQAPYQYKKTENYPLIIALHGLTKSKDAFFTPIIANREDQAMNFPCFYLAPNNTSKGWDENAIWVRELVSELIKAYPIDINRIYIIGFSYGGSGSYLFADALYKEKGFITAAIVRCAGKSQTELAHELIPYTSVWYHIGEDDLESIKNTAEETYLRFKTAHPHLIEEKSIFSIAYNERITYTLSGNNDVMMKYSIYKGMGHEYAPIFANIDVLKWLFKQSLIN